MDTKLRLQLTILPPTLVVSQVCRSDLDKVAFGLLQILVLERNSNEDRFVSVTDTGNEISLILDEANSARFNKNGVASISGVQYKAFQVAGEGSLGFALTGIVQSISEPLAKANISIFYLSTFETDFVFVPIQHVLLAVSVLRQRFAVQVEGYDEAALPAQEPPAISKPLDVKRHPLCIDNSKYHLASLPKDIFDSVGTALLKLLFKPESGRTFFSYTETSTSVSDEISIIMDQKDVQYFPEDVMNLSTEGWKLIKVGESPLGFEEAGIVSSISSTLSAANISLFYVSTFLTDYCLVQEQDYELALATLKQAGYIVKK